MIDILKVNASFYILQIALPFMRKFHGFGGYRPRSTRAMPAFVTCIVIFAGLLALVVLGYGFNIIAPKDPVAIDPAVAVHFISPEKLRPKPHDRFMFQAMVVCGFVVLALFATVWRRLNQPADPRATFLLCATLSGAVALCFGLWGGLLQLFSKPHLTETLLCVLVTVAIAWISATGRLEASRKWLLIATFLSTVLFMGATRIFTASTISYGGHITSHYEAVVYSIVHIAAGGTCLADVLTQYGCYGEFIAPIIRVADASPTVITLVLVALLSLAMLAIIVFSASLIRATALLITAIACVIIGSSMTLMLGSPDPVFQYNPVRTFFPALSLICVLAIQRRPSLLNAGLLGAFAGLSIAWNVDTGIAVVGSLGLFTFSVGFTKPGCLCLPALWAGLKRAICFIAAALIALTAFYFYLQVKSGLGVNLAAALTYQIAYYVAGFGMLPIPAFPHLWTIAAIVIAVGLLTALAAISGGSDPTLERAFYLAILSIGLLLYYTGRSHLLVLRLVVWPEVLLFFYLADQAVIAWRSNTIAKFSTIGFAVFLPLASTVFYFPVWSTVITGMWKPAFGSELVEQDISFLRSLTTPGENIAIIAENQTTFYFATRTWPSMTGPSLAETQLVKDRDILKDDVARRGPKKIFVDSRPITGEIEFNSNSIDLQSHYDLKATGPGGRLLYFVRRD